MGKKYKEPIDPRDRMSTEERELKREQKNTCDEYYKGDCGLSSIGGLFSAGLNVLSFFANGRRLPPGTCK